MSLLVCTLWSSVSAYIQMNIIVNSYIAYNILCFYLIHPPIHGVGQANTSYTTDRPSVEVETELLILWYHTGYGTT